MNRQIENKNIAPEPKYLKAKSIFVDLFGSISLSV